MKSKGQSPYHISDNGGNPSGRVLVLNAHAKPGLVATRSLGARGLHVNAGSSRRFYSGRLSKYAEQAMRYPSPEDDLDGFIRAVEQELRVGEYDLLLPINETTVETVVKYKSRFEQYTNVPFLPYERLRVGLNKRRTIEAARESDIPHPETLFSEEADLETVRATLDYPVVIKPERGSGRRGVLVCDSSEELEQAFANGRAEKDSVLFQEFVPNGGERGVYTLYSGARS